MDAEVGMDLAQGLGSSLRIVHTAEEISRRVTELGEELTEAYSGSEGLVVLGVLKGSFIFVADLVRAIRLPLQVDFLIASSYGAGQLSSGIVKVLREPEVDMRDRDVLLVEDIVDSGATLDRLLPIVEAKGPKSVEVCTLLHKRLSRLPREPRWVGFEAPDAFLVGYGLDHAERYRHLPFIASV